MRGRLFFRPRHLIRHGCVLFHHRLRRRSPFPKGEGYGFPLEGEAVTEGD